jgi:predicted nucleic acid-binding protein
MNFAFWDTSALVPLCIEQQPSANARQLLQQYEIVVWWATAVEMRSSFQRLLRMGELTVENHASAGARLEKMRRTWRELQPTELLRAQAETFLVTASLKAADALQLAAAWVWSSGNPQSCVFISGDLQLLEAATQTGFQVVAV